MNEIAERSPETIAAEINAIKAQTRTVIMAAAMEIGKRLIEAKNLVPTGRWIEWLRTNVDYSERTAQNLMRCFYEYRDGLPDNMANVSFTNTVELLSLPSDQREELIESGEAASLSIRELKAKIKELRAEKEQDLLTIANLQDAAMSTNKKAMELNDRLFEAQTPKVIEQIPHETMQELQMLRAQSRQQPNEHRILFDELLRKTTENISRMTDLIQLAARTRPDVADKMRRLLVTTVDVIQRQLDK